MIMGVFIDKEGMDAAGLNDPDLGQANGGMMIVG
jgi:hypothetical protein